MWEAAALLAIGAGLAFWIDSRRAACERSGLQLLDETVAGSGLRLARNDDGELRIRRVFVFEFSDNGNNRRRGSVVVLGATVQDLYLEPYAVQ